MSLIKNKSKFVKAIWWVITVTIIVSIVIVPLLAVLA